MLSLEASLSAVHSERSQSDLSLKSRMQELLLELQSTLQVGSRPSPAGRANMHSAQGLLHAYTCPVNAKSLATTRNACTFCFGILWGLLCKGWSGKKALHDVQSSIRVATNFASRRT